MRVVDCKDLHYRQLNSEVRRLLAKGEDKLVLREVNGQRYIGAGLAGSACLEIEGTAGNNVGAMMNGLTIIVSGNAQDGVGNTMYNGKIIVRGSAGDIVGYAMRGGRILVHQDVGWRTGIHMKEQRDARPVIVIGGTAGDFLGEYMAGGVIVVLGINKPLSSASDSSNPLVGHWVASGMHGGRIYIRGTLPSWQTSLGQVRVELVTPEQCSELQEIIDDFSTSFDIDLSGMKRETFSKISPLGARPFAHLYNHS